MKAAVLHEVHGPLSIEDFEMPTISSDEVLIKVKACGVCHTDLKVIEGRIQSLMPAIIGHEVSGTIEEVGSTQRGAFKVGDAVAIAAGAVSIASPAGKTFVARDLRRRH
jgi:D-arabinose 1-dehydrogenase-like Zn-dependent alcohol dehydrogenase